MNLINNIMQLLHFFCKLIEYIKISNRIET